MNGLCDPGRFVALLALAVVVGLLVFMVARARSAVFKEKGHFVLSFVPWLQIAVSYSTAFYVRIGFGAWPRSCIDNPDLPFIEPLAMIALLGNMLVVGVIGPLWLGWLVVRLCQNLRRHWLASAVVLVSGMAALITLHVTDPWGFWAWVLD